LLKIGAPLLASTLVNLFENTIRAQKQEEPAHAKTAPKLTAENTRIQWNASLAQLTDQIRGLNPYPGAWTYLKNNGQELRIKIFDAKPLYTPTAEKKGSLLVKESQLIVAHPEGYLICKEIQLPNKKRMQVSALLNGYSIGADACIR